MFGLRSRKSKCNLPWLVFLLYVGSNAAQQQSALGNGGNLPRPDGKFSWPDWPWTRNKTMEKYTELNIKNDYNQLDVSAFSDFERHPCRRNCQLGQSQTCYYQLVVHHYQRLGPECRRCLQDEHACAEEYCIYGDGVANPIMVVNRMMPAPAIELCENDTVIADVVNYSNEPTAMHWHGIHMSLTPEMDGGPFITQYPIQPGEVMRYAFKADRSGTVWYHSHVGWQRGMGVAGNMIIRQPQYTNLHAALYDYDLVNHTLMVQDIFYDNNLQQVRNILVNGKGRNHLSQKPDSDSYHRYERLRVTPGYRYRMRVIYNGVFNCPVEFSIDQHKLLIISTDGNDIEPVLADGFYLTSAERFDFVLDADKYAKNYWIRVRGFVQCERLNLYQGAVLSYRGAARSQLPDGNITASEGPLKQDSPEPKLYVNDFRSGSVNITAVRTHAQTSPATEVFHGNAPAAKLQKQTSANNATAAKIESKQSRQLAAEEQKVFINDFRFGANNATAAQMQAKAGVAEKDNNVGAVALRSMHPVPWPRYTKFLTYYSNFNIRVTSTGEILFQIDDISYSPPGISLLQARHLYDDDTYFCNRSSLAHQGLNCAVGQCECLNVIRMPAYKPIEMVVTNFMSESHPFHIHGYTFRVVAQAVMSVSDLRNIKELDRRGYLKRLPDDYAAVAKDTVQVPAQGYIIVRFISDNPGFWLYHCHIEEHAVLGMMAVLKIGENHQIKRIPTKVRC